VICKKPLVIVLGALAIGALIGAVLQGQPEQLPTMALGSVLVLYALRTAVLFAVGTGILLMLIKAWGGELPTELGVKGLRYEAGEATKKINQNINRIEEQVNHRCN
jgi:hypothetical protein